MYSYHVDAPGTPVTRTLGLSPLSLAVGDVSGLLLLLVAHRHQSAVILSTTNAYTVAVLAVRAVERNRRLGVTRVHCLLRKSLCQPQLQIFLDRHRYTRKECRKPFELSEELLENVTHLHCLPAPGFHIQFLLVFQIVAIPAEQVCRRLCVSIIIDDLFWLERTINQIHTVKTT